MKILFVSAILPYPLFSGGQVRIYHLLKRLSKKHEITLYAFVRSEKEKEFVRELSFCTKVVTVMRGRAWQMRYIVQSLFGSFPFLYATYNNSHMRKLLEEELQNNFDLIHLEPGYVWLSVPDTSLPIVVSEHNIEHDVYRKYAEHSNVFLRPFLNWDVAKMERWERTIWQKASHVTAASDDDKRYIEAEGVPTTVVANGVDTEYFSFHPKKTISSKAPVFLYVGTYRWIQNRDALQYLLGEIWPAILKKYPKATLRIVGKKLEGKQGVISFTSVADIRVEYRKADMLLAPIRVGGGTKYKILESMASGLPVMTTPLGASGMDIQDRKEVWIAKSVDETLNAILDIITGKDRTHILAQARKVVEDHFSWDHIAQVLDSVWKK